MLVGGPGSPRTGKCMGEPKESLPVRGAPRPPQARAGCTSHDFLKLRRSSFFNRQERQERQGSGLVFLQQLRPHRGHAQPDDPHSFDAAGFTADHYDGAFRQIQFLDQKFR